jgi:hypothetical protein
MEFAISCPARPDVWKDLAVAEDHGFTQAWFYDSQMIYSDRSRRRKTLVEVHHLSGRMVTAPVARL